MSNKLVYPNGLGYGRLGSTVNLLPAALAPLQKKVVTDEATQKTREKTTFRSYKNHPWIDSGRDGID